MEDRQADFILYILGVVGLLVLLAPILDIYEWKYGVFGAVIIWIIAGGIRRYFAIPSNR